ncbi:MAG: hypothetical protein E7625_06280 [Ruminococcaceae bacterium]|nr:hypothetical protein [Oscillospiraceae bacterium]
MNISNFFEGNSVSMEVIQLYEEYRLEKNVKSALRAVYRVAEHDYVGEEDQNILFRMALYWCGLQNNYVDVASRDFLEGLTETKICNVFGLSDGQVIRDVLAQLLVAEPTKPPKKKIDYRNPGPKNWKPGDVYAYQLCGQQVQDSEIAGKYALIYCLENEVMSSRKNRVKLYLLLCNKDPIQQSIDQVLASSIFLPRDLLRIYRYKLEVPHHEYPTSSLIYVGNVAEICKPAGEILPPSEYHYSLVVWQSFEEKVLRHYEIHKRLEKN